MMIRLLPAKLLLLCGSLVLLVAVACAPAAPAPAATGAPSAPAAKPAAKFPSKPIIFVAPGTVGGGADTQARLAADAIEKAKLTEEPIAVLNKGTGGSQEAYSFVKSKKGDAHYLLTTTAQFLTYPMTGQAAYETKDFVPIANLAYDPYVVVAKPDSKWNTLKDMIDAAKASPGTITSGLGQIGTQDHMAMLTLESAAGIKLKPVHFAGGADIHRNVLGGQVEMAVCNPADVMASLEGNKLKTLGFLSPERNPAPGLKNIPTAKEQGYNVLFEIWRGWFAPAGISADEIKFLENMFAKVMDNQDFKEKYLFRYGMRPGYMNSADFTKYLQGEEATYKKLLTSAGVIK